MINFAVVGCGYWGPNLVRNIYENDNTSIVRVCDLAPTRLNAILTRYPKIQVSTNYNDILLDKTIDAVAVATPVNTHFDLTLKALEAGKHVLVEKPLCGNSQQCSILIEEAKKRNLVLMVDHTFVYTGAVRKIKNVIETGELGDILYYDAQRVNLGLFQPDVDVLWDLAVHDLSILDYILEAPPTAVSATGIGHVDGAPENIAYMTLFFDGSLIGHINVNWLAPTKIRRTLIGGSKKMVVYDELEPSEKIKIYDKGITIESPVQEDLYKIMVSYRTGDMMAPQFDNTEALKTEIAHFTDCILNGTTPITNGVVGRRVVRILEAASQSMREGGKPIQLP